MVPMTVPNYFNNSKVLDIGPADFAADHGINACTVYGAPGGEAGNAELELETGEWLLDDRLQIYTEDKCEKKMQKMRDILPEAGSPVCGFVRYPPVPWSPGKTW